MKKPEKQLDKKIVEKVPEILEEKGELTTPQLAKELADKNVASESTARSRLYGFREYIVSNYDVFSEKRPDNQPGEPTRYWRTDK